MTEVAGTTDDRAQTVTEVAGTTDATDATDATEIVSPISSANADLAGARTHPLLISSLFHAGFDGFSLRFRAC